MATPRSSAAAETESRRRGRRESKHLAPRFWTEPLDERFAKIGIYEVYQVKCKSRERAATALWR
jgi:hypothetical protein